VPAGEDFIGSGDDRPGLLGRQSAQASARMSSAGIFSVEMSKWCSDLSVCAPQRRSAATAMSPNVSFSMR